jgi:hypothetical protein
MTRHANHKPRAQTGNRRIEYSPNEDFCVSPVSAPISILGHPLTSNTSQTRPLRGHGVPNQATQLKYIRSYDLPCLFLLYLTQLQNSPYKYRVGHAAIVSHHRPVTHPSLVFIENHRQTAKLAFPSTTNLKSTIRLRSTNNVT